MRITIDGASSCLAKELGNLFLKDNHNINYITRSKSRFSDTNSQAISCFNYDETISPNPSGKSLFIQLACATPNNTSDHSNIGPCNHEVIKNINNHLDLNHYDYLVNISTMSVYGNIAGGYISNLSETIPRDSYGESKLLIEKTIQSYATTSKQPPKCLTLRLPGLISAKTQNIFLSKCVNRIIANEPINIPRDERFNNATCSYDIYKTILQWVKYSASSKLSNYVLNMHSEDTVNISDLLNFMARALSASSPNIVINSEIKSFTIKNEEHSIIPSLSSIFDIVNPLLGSEQL